MGLTRSSSGLLVYDAFGSDTSANYTLTGATINISGGVCDLSAGYAMHESSSGVMCVTMKYETAMVVSCPGPHIGPHLDMSDGANKDGYFARNNASSSLQLYKIDGGSATKLAECAADLTMYSEGYIRMYRSGSSVVAKEGAAALTYSVNATDTTFTGTNYGGAREGSVTTLWFDNLDLRTAHTITCTGMTTGHYLRVSDGTTAAEAQESSGTATVDAGAVLFPLATVQIRTAAAGGGDLIAELDTGDYADMGGGDAFAYSGASAAWLPFMKHNVIGLGGLHG